MRLIVKAIDPDAPGSYRARDRLFSVYGGLRNAKGPEESVAAYRAARDFILERAETDDGTPVEEALDQVSANQFDELLVVLLRGGEETIPPVSSGS
jgi:hypothetical protein